MIVLNKYYNNFPIVLLGYEKTNKSIKVYLKNVSDKEIDYINIKYNDRLYKFEVSDNDFSLEIKTENSNIMYEIEVYSVIVSSKEIKPFGKEQIIPKVKPIVFLGREKYLFLKEASEKLNIEKNEIKYLPNKGDIYWNCTCGQLNFQNEKCLNCGENKEQVTSLKKEYSVENNITNERIAIAKTYLMWSIIIYVFFMITHILFGEFVFDNERINSFYGILNRFIMPILMIIGSLTLVYSLNRYLVKLSIISEISIIIISLYLNISELICTVSTAYMFIYTLLMDIVLLCLALRYKLGDLRIIKLKKCLAIFTSLIGLIFLIRVIYYSKFDLDVIDEGLVLTIETKDDEYIVPNKINGQKVKRIVFKDTFDYKISKLIINKDLELVRISSNAVLKNLNAIETANGAIMYVKDNILYDAKGKIILVPQNVKKVTLEKENIDSFSLYYAENVEEIYIKNTVKVIEYQAFQNCKNLKRIIFEENSTLQEIQDKAFMNCESLELINLPISLQKIGYSVFYGCNNVNEVTMPFIGTCRENDPRNVFATDLFVRLFGGTVENDFTLCSNQLEKIQILDIICIHNATFYKIENVKEIILPEELKFLGIRSFYGCISLTSFTIPTEVEIVPEECFKNCKSLTKVVLSKNIKRIEKNAFLGCDNLKEIVYDGDKTKLVIEEGNEELLKLLRSR